VGENFDIAPSSIVLSTLEQELAGEIGRESQLWETLNDFKGNYDYILIDCPPNLGILTINAIRAANELIIPVEASRFSLEGLSKLIDIINLVKERLNHNVNYQVVVTNFDSRLRHSFKMLDKIKSAFRDKLLSNIIHVNVKLKEAQNEGTHILDYDKYCRGAKDYFSLAREIITQEKQPALETILANKMQEVVRREVPKSKEVVFSIFAPEAKEVFLAGDFNEWKMDDSGRMEVKDGLWIKKAKLKPGHYRYRFVTDGKWIEDPYNLMKEQNPFGSMDSLIDVNQK
jgi:hypothetical protein